MKIKCSFYSLKNLSDLSNGENLLKILFQNNLEIKNANDREPINIVFDIDNFPKIWLMENQVVPALSQTFLFKGSKEISFKGMAIWIKNLHSNSKEFGGISIWLNVKKGYDIDKIVKLGDDLFTWSEAVYGYISEDSYSPSYGFNKNHLEKCKYPEYVRRRNGRESKNGKIYTSRGNLYQGLYDPMWISYFGIPYLQEVDFRLPENRLTIGHGSRIKLTEKPNDEILCEPDYLAEIKRNIGDEWFWQNPKISELKLPFFDRNEITRNE